MRARPALALAVFTVSALVAGCGSATPTPATTPSAAPEGSASAAAGESPPSRSAPGSTPAASEPAEAAALRTIAFAYWDGYNAYDVDAVLALLEPGERAKREANIRDEIGRLKTFGVKLGISEQSAPALTGPDTAEMLVTMKEPLGSRTMKMVFLRSGDTWLVTAADEVPK